MGIPIDDLALQSLQHLQDAFVKDAASFTGFVPLSSIMPSTVIDQYSPFLPAEYVSEFSHDTPVAVVLSRNYYGFNSGEPGGYKATTLMLSQSGKWIVYVARREDPPVFIVGNAKKLQEVLYDKLSPLGVLQHRAGKPVDIEHISKHLRAVMLTPYSERELALIRTCQALWRLDAERNQMGLPSL